MPSSNRWLPLLGAAVVWLGGASDGRAAGTLATTPIDNRATVNYEVNSVAQTEIESSPTGNSTPGSGSGEDTTFVVDDKVDVTVAEESSGYTNTSAGATQQVLAFTVTNTGNRVHDFSLSAADQVGGADPFGGTDNFDATGAGIFLDVNDNGVYEPGTDTRTWVDELAPDATARVFVVRDIPGGQVEDDVSAVTLTAQVAAGGVADTQGADITTDDAASADDPATVQIVFADGAGDTDAVEDGTHSDTDAYRVTTANLTVAKSSAVVSDPFNGTTNPKAIPGAIIEYTVTVSNDAGASATASSITVTDSLDTEITAGTVAFDADAYGSGEGMQVTAPNINGGATKDLTNAADSDEGSFASNVVTVSGIELDPGESATVTFRVQIQ